MTRRRFYAPATAFDAGRVTLDSNEARHLREVLRLRAGDEVFVFDGAGREFLCVVLEPGRGNGEATLEVRAEAEPASPESALELTLAVALLKGEKFDLVVQKATELGVKRIMPVATARADVRLRDESDAARRVARWQRLALEACKQSGRARLPAVDAPISFTALLESTTRESFQARLLFAERLGRGLLETLAETRRPQSVCALVGPEGGWEEEELARAREAGWSIVTLGGRILRAETAAIAITALLQHLCGDLR
ncbi:MAG: 16S rRNA (uracil(1498)-N(3))-methyltransferase [Acidobacteria bacterium]|nr:16S rRNA (uracil(1498)-N(3))-methyltransferase [Acidobacteriota bacterium]